MGKKVTVNVSFDLLSVLQTVFIVLKLLKLIDWSWWLVLIPLWIGIVIFIIAIIFVVVVNSIRRNKW